MSDEPDWIQRALAQEERFWAEQYPDFSRKEKIRLWTADLSRDMRAQEEANANQYASINPKWFAWALSRDPELTNILPEIVRSLRTVDAGRFYASIEQPLPPEFH